MATKILRLPDVKHRTGLSRSSIYLRVSEQTFPEPISLGGRAVGWVESEVEDWIHQQISKRSHQIGQSEMGALSASQADMTQVE